MRGQRRLLEGRRGDEDEGRSANMAEEKAEGRSRRGGKGGSYGDDVPRLPLAIIDATLVELRRHEE